MSDDQVIATFSTVEGLLVALAQRRHSQGLSQLALDEVAGLQAGYVGKIEAGVRGLGAISLPSILGGLRCELALVPIVRTPRTHREESLEFHENRMTRNARKAVAARWARTTPKQRKKIARAAAKARWAKAKRAEAGNAGSCSAASAAGEGTDPTH